MGFIRERSVDQPLTSWIMEFKVMKQKIRKVSGSKGNEKCREIVFTV